MAASLEMRAPFLDHELVSWGLALPASLKIRGSEGKYILKKSLETLLPHEILYRPKQGFTSDLAPMFRAESARLRQRLLNGPMLAHDLFDAAAIARVLDEHETGRLNHAGIIWLLLAFEGFLVTLEAKTTIAQAA